MVIYIDFDRTMFDTDHFIKDLYALMEKRKVNLTIFERIREEQKEQGFNWYNILLEVEKECPFDKEIFSEIEEFIKNDLIYLYPDTREFLDYLRKKKYHLCMFTA